jgi:hypothetical protein
MNNLFVIDASLQGRGKGDMIEVGRSEESDEAIYCSPVICSARKARATAARCVALDQCILKRWEGLHLVVDQPQAANGSCFRDRFKTRASATVRHWDPCRHQGRNARPQDTTTQRLVNVALLFHPLKEIL